jgi:hypothetical protein
MRFSLINHVALLLPMCAPGVSAQHYRNATIYAASAIEKAMAAPKRGKNRRLQGLGSKKKSKKAIPINVVMYSKKSGVTPTAVPSATPTTPSVRPADSLAPSPLPQNSLNAVTIIFSQENVPGTSGEYIVSNDLIGEKPIWYRDGNINSGSMMIYYCFKGDNWVLTSTFWREELIRDNGGGCGGYETTNAGGVWDSRWWSYQWNSDVTFVFDSLDFLDISLNRVLEVLRDPKAYPLEELEATRYVTFIVSCICFSGTFPQISIMHYLALFLRLWIIFD